VGLLLAGWRQFATWKLRRRIAALERETALAQERSRIAQEIHDDLGATLTHISLLSQLDPAADSGGQASPQLREIHASARAATRAVDEIVWALNPEHDTLDSLVNYLIRFAEDFVSSAHLRCRLSLPANLPEVDVTSEVRHNLLLAVKEALHNAVQHAAAAEVRLRLEWDGRTFVFIVEDDGRGFNLDDVGTGDGNGIANLHRRLAAAGGTCEIHSTRGSGTQVRLCIPAPAESRVQQPSPVSL
jgi:signal transduction histidine kinase